MNTKNLTGLHLEPRPVIIFLLLFFSCLQPKDDAAKLVTIQWKDGRAVSLSIPKTKLTAIPEDLWKDQIEVRLAHHGEQPAIAADMVIHEDALIFTPLLPFSRGLTYTIFLHHQALQDIEIPLGKDAPQLISISPGADTVPENLLKIYLQFSEPMEEGHALQFVQLTNEKDETLPNSFLDLRHELWNNEVTMLTLWLDPGRIKRDLQPNQLLGPPLTAGKIYRLKVLRDWPDQKGRRLADSSVKQFIVGQRDSISPKPERWTLDIPLSGSLSDLNIHLDEPLDNMLLKETVSIQDPSGESLSGSVKVDKNGCLFSFTPIHPWASGHYKIKIEARLEDLAGNNLTRLFDVDLRQSKSSGPAPKIFERTFIIK